jgi:predicted nucleic acid-binding protein
MKRFFIDSSVLFSAAYSSRGYSRDLVLMAAGGELILVASMLVLEEVRRNLAVTALEVVPIFEYLLEIVPFEMVQPTRDEVLEAAQRVALKDAPIVAAAKKGKGRSVGHAR